MQIMTNQTWTRRGVSILWDANALSMIAKDSKVISIRQFFALCGKWPDDLPASDGDALVVAGLEGILDILSAEDAAAWLEDDLKSAMFSFQDEYQGDAALIFWTPGGRNRIRPNMAAATYGWKCAAPHGRQMIHIGRNLWGGAENELCRIILSDEANPDPDGPAWGGLFHPRLS